MKKFALTTLVLLSGCAHPYTLDPLGEKPEYLNGIALSTAVLPKCTLQAGYQYSNPNEMLVKVRILNKDKAPFDIDSSSFLMRGPAETVKNSPLSASEPDRYVRDLTSAAEIYESRTKMETYQGVEALAELKGTGGDAEIQAAKDEYKRKTKDAENARDTAEALRKRVAIIDPVALRKNTVKAGEVVEGALIFKSDFGETGVVTIESTHPSCPAKITFMLKK